MRRGSPATHIIFGPSQTINSATYVYARCFEKVSSLSQGAVLGFICRDSQHEHDCCDIMLTKLDELHQLHIGQSLDLHWTYNCIAPTIEEYFAEIEQSKQCPATDSFQSTY
jgi:geranylgeranyl pyrophosphate synthase